jgi:hypothetical protein
MMVVDVEGRQNPVSIEAPDSSLDSVLSTIRAHAGLGKDVPVFEREKDDELSGNLDGRSGISVIAHSCKRIDVSLRFEHRVESEKFPPSATVFRVLQWAIGKKAFNLDSTAAAKANLILPGTDTPLPRDALIGRYVQGTCALVLELTLRDFTNG